MHGLDKTTFELHTSLFKIRLELKVNEHKVWIVEYPEYKAPVAFLYRAFVFPKTGQFPEASLNLEQSSAGRFFGETRRNVYHNLGVAPEGNVAEVFLDKTEAWLEQYFGEPLTVLVRLA